SFAPRALLRFIALTNPSATLSPSIHFPLFTVIESTLLQRFLPGTRRASPVARYVLVTVLSLSPRWSGAPFQSDSVASCCLHNTDNCSTSRATNFRGYLCVHFRYGPMTRNHPLGGLVDRLQSLGFPPPCYPNYGAPDFYPGRTNSC